VNAAINAGLDMVMVPYNYQEFINLVTTQVNNGQINESRIEDAVRRILRVKFAAGLFEKPMSDRNLLTMVGSADHRAIAREAVRKSLVLLKNALDPRGSGFPMLPLNKAAPKILVAGTHADDIGLQCGGWTISWQGSSGRTTIGKSILAHWIHQLHH
jgi:beta-glucosidase-like glycosyl hydrolase